MMRRRPRRSNGPLFTRFDVIVLPAVGVVIAQIVMHVASQFLSHQPFP